MKLAVIGLGSMGKRRLALLLKHFPDIEACGVDINEERRLHAAAVFGIKTYADLNSALSKERPYAALVCTPPLSHGHILLECIKEGLHVFSELNLVPDQYEEIARLAVQNRVKLFLSSTMLYRMETEFICGCVKRQNARVNYRYHVGQYLPDWHPWESYKDFFVGDVRTNACREIFAIELPWMIKAFGKVKDAAVFKDNISSLDIDYPDNYFVFLIHENGSKGAFIVDIVSRKAQRDLLVYSEKLHLVWHGTPDTLFKYNIEKKQFEKTETYINTEKDDRYADFIIENAYLEELQQFINKITGKPSNEKYTFEDDRLVLQLIDRIEGIMA